MKVQQRKGHILHVPMVLPCSPQPAAPWAPCAHPQWYQSISRGLCGTEPRSAGLAGSSARLLGAGCVTPPRPCAHSAARTASDKGTGGLRSPCSGWPCQHAVPWGHGVPSWAGRLVLQERGQALCGLWGPGAGAEQSCPLAPKQP